MSSGSDETTSATADATTNTTRSTFILERFRSQAVADSVGGATAR